MDDFWGYGKMGHGAPKAAFSSSSDGGVWCVTEKVHGANFSLHVDRAGRIRCAKRTSFLAEHEDFFGHFSVLKQVRTGAIQLAFELFASRPDLERVILFGELCGGHYPHNSVKALAGVRPVQTGIWYSPQVEFVLFDIALTCPEARVFMPFCQVVDLADKHEILHVKPLFIGPRGECASASADFVTGIPPLLRLPAIENNKAEGIVAKPWDKETPMLDRAIFKVKTKEFSEGDGCAPTPGDPAMREYLLSLVNENRVAAAASKVGDLDNQARWEEIVQNVILDIIEEVGDEDPTFFQLRDQLQCEAFDILADQAVSRRGLAPP